MTSTHRRNVDLMQKCAQEVGTSLDRVKVHELRLFKAVIKLNYFKNRTG